VPPRPYTNHNRIGWLGGAYVVALCALARPSRRRQVPSRLTDPCDPDPDDELAKLSPRRMQPTAGNLASLRGQQVRKSIRAPAAGSGDDSDLEVVAGVFQRHALTLVFLPLRQAEEATSSRRKPPVCLVGGRSGRPPRGSG